MMTVANAVLNALNYFAALLVLGQADYLKAFTHEQRDAVAMIFVSLNNNAGQGLLEIFWTPFYFSFGLLIIRSKFLPKILGILLIVTSLGFPINILQKFLIPQFHPAAFTQMAMALGAIGILPTLLWLLIKGANVRPLPAVS